MARAMWKAVIRFDEVALPVKFYSAVQDRTVRFRLLHEEDDVPVRQRMVNPEGGGVVEQAEARRGFEVERDRFVVFRPEELEALEPDPSRDIHVSRFVPVGTIGHEWYDRPYYLGPDGNDAAYTAFAAALARRRQEAVARWVMRKKAYLGAIRSAGSHLVLMTLRHTEEVIPSHELEAPQGRELAQRERAMAEKFVEALTDELDLGAYEDRYRQRVLHLVELKRKGESVPVPEREDAEEPSEDLGELLEKSLAELG